MIHHWLIITFSWFGSVSLQYINTGGPRADVGFDTMDPQYPVTVAHYPPPPRNRANIQPDPLTEEFYQRDDILSELTRKRRDETAEVRDRRWAPPMQNAERNIYFQEQGYAVGPTDLPDENVAEDVLDAKEKRYFSPWGGKRGGADSWTWKRANNVREPGMPKRVRFSPWGGKRSGQMIYKPGSKNSKVAYSKMASKFAPIRKRFNFAGLQLVRNMDKDSPLRFFVLSTKSSDRTSRDAMPFNSFLEALPKLFKPGHPYLDVNLKKDGKRKVKFSAWGGKRSPPIIGPIWTPAAQAVKDNTLETILLLRDSKDLQQDMSKAS